MERIVTNLRNCLDNYIMQNITITQTMTSSHVCLRSRTVSDFCLLTRSGYDYSKKTKIEGVLVWSVTAVALLSSTFLLHVSHLPLPSKNEDFLTTTHIDLVKILISACYNPSWKLNFTWSRYTILFVGTLVMFRG